MLVVLTLAAGAGGCDSDDGGGGGGGGAGPPKAKPRAAGTSATSAQQKAIEAVLVRLFKSQDVIMTCERSLTPRLFRLTYRDRAACRRVEASDEDDKPPKRVEVSDIEARGESATANVKLIGGDPSGGHGEVSLLHGKGGWRVDDLSIGLLRSALRASLRNDDDLPASTARCIDRRFTGIPDGRFKPFAYGLIGERPRPTRRLLEMWLACERGRKGVSSLRRPVEKALREQLTRAKASRKVAECVIRRLRSTLPDERIIALSTPEDRGAKAQLNREVVAAAIACGFRPPSEPGGDLSPT